MVKNKQEKKPSLVTRMKNWFSRKAQPLPQKPIEREESHPSTFKDAKIWVNNKGEVVDAYKRTEDEWEIRERAAEIIQDAFNRKENVRNSSILALAEVLSEEDKRFSAYESGMQKVKAPNTERTDSEYTDKIIKISKDGRAVIAICDYGEEVEVVYYKFIYKGKDPETNNALIEVRDALDGMIKVPEVALEEEKKMIFDLGKKDKTRIMVICHASTISSAVLSIRVDDI